MPGSCCRSLLGRLAELPSPQTLQILTWEMKRRRLNA